MLEVLFLGAVVWVPLSCLLEWRRARRYGFLPGSLVWLGMVAAIVGGAAAAPTKWEDRNHIGPFPNPEMSIGELSGILRRDYRPMHFPDSRLSDRIRLPKRRMSFREFGQELERQTGLKLGVGYCGNDRSILWGGYPMGFAFAESFDLRPELGEGVRAWPTLVLHRSGLLGSIAR